MDYKDKELDLHAALLSDAHPGAARGSEPARDRARPRLSGRRRSRDLFRRLFGWIRRRAAAARLHALDDRMLKDIGLYRGDIETAVRGSEQPAERRKAA